jgi:hypothetical protein
MTSLRDRLQAAEAAGRLPAAVPTPLHVGEAAALALQLPLATYDDVRPVGYGLYPPRGAEPLLRLARDTAAVDGHVVAAGALGALGVLWNGKRGAVHRIFFNSHGSPLRWVDCYADAIGSVEVVGDKPPSLMGWEIGAL